MQKAKNILKKENYKEKMLFSMLFVGTSKNCTIESLIFFHLLSELYLKTFLPAIFSKAWTS